MALAPLVADVYSDGAPDDGPHREGSGPVAALLPAYGDLADEFRDGMDCCATVLDRCIDRELKRGGLGLYSGWPGVGWTAAHLDADDDALGEHVDRLLVHRLQDWPPRAGYDLISGVVGVGVYFLERLPKDIGRHGLALVLDELERSVEKTPAGATWFTPPESLPAWQREQAPRGYYNLGVAHGVPGVVSLLGNLCAAGLEVHRAEPLLRSGLAWLMAQQPEPEDPNLPSWIAPGVPRRPGRRMAWCYGPLGVAAVVLPAARAIADEPAIDWARTLALACAKVQPEDALVQDAGLCHGAAGNAQIFFRLAEREGDPEFHRAGARWLEATLNYRRPGEGVGGYRMWGEVEAGRQGWVDDPSFLSGSAGVGLLLLTAATGIEPAWDRLLLLS